jgi:hypothetical protein
MPTPAPTPLALAGVPRPPSGVVMHAQASQPLQAAAAEAAMASEPQFRQPAPRGVLTGHKHVTVVAAEPGQGLPGVAASPAAATAFDFLCMAGTTAAGASAAPMDVDGAPAAAAPAPAAAPQPAAPLLQQQQQLAASAAATAAAAEAPMVAAAEVPTPVIQAFAAEGQPGYLHPRPLACPPLFKQPTPAGSRWVCRRRNGDAPSTAASQPCMFPIPRLPQAFPFDVWPAWPADPLAAAARSFAGRRPSSRLWASRPPPQPSRTLLLPTRRMALPTAQLA